MVYKVNPQHPSPFADTTLHFTHSLSYYTLCFLHLQAARLLHSSPCLASPDSSTMLTLTSLVDISKKCRQGTDSPSHYWLQSLLYPERNFPFLIRHAEEFTHTHMNTYGYVQALVHIYMHFCRWASMKYTQQRIPETCINPYYTQYMWENHFPTFSLWTLSAFFIFVDAIGENCKFLFGFHLDIIVCMLITEHQFLTLF